MKYYNNVLLLATMLEEMRLFLGSRSMYITSWYRAAYYNDIVMKKLGYHTSFYSDHKEARAVDVLISPTNANVQAWIAICEKHNVKYSIGLYPSSNFMHLGFGSDKNRMWDENWYK